MVILALMAVEFRNVSLAPLLNLSASVPAGAVVGVVGEDGSGKGRLLRLAAGLERPESGEVETGLTRRLLGPDDPLDLAPVDVLAMEHALARHDAVVRARALIGLDRLRRGGATVFFVSHEEELLARACDEIWWLHQGTLAARGDPGEVLAAWRSHAASRLREWGTGACGPLPPALRRGDGRAQLLEVLTLGEDGRPTMVWSSGEQVAVRVVVRFSAAVADPVVGIMLRTRIGSEVYGTNTELEKVILGPRRAGDTVQVSFRFRCDLCPREYTITAASHDQDGTWHDWLEDAVAFSVTDSRYSAGVANLRASVEATCISGSG